MFKIEPGDIELNALFEYIESILMDVILIRSQGEEDGEEEESYRILKIF